MKVIVVILTFSVLCLQKSYAQNPDPEAVKSTITRFFEAMRNSDTATIRGLLFTGARLETVIRNKTGESQVKEEDFEKFLQSMGKPHPEVYDERITFASILIDDNLAIAWTPYQFYVGDKYHHQGVNAFQLVKTRDEKWKILSILDTRRK